MDGDNEPEQAAFDPQLKEMEIALEHIKALENASLDSEIEPLDPGFLERIRNPPMYSQLIIPIINSPWTYFLLSPMLRNWFTTLFEQPYYKETPRARF